MQMRVAINGFGRIGRLVLRAGINSKKIEWVALNDLADAHTLAHLFKYDSTFGTYPGSVEVKDSEIIIDGKKIKCLSEKEPSKLPWKELGVELVVESTGKFTDAEKAKAHLEAGAKKVLISAPAKGDVLTICYGINEYMYDPKKHNIVSNASCTTNCLAPLAKILNDNLKIKRGLMTTVHAYTNDQNILDLVHRDLRRARAGASNIIPSTTGAAKAIGVVIPELKGKLTGIAIRVPVPDVSIVDLTVETEKTATLEEVNNIFKEAASGPYQKILDYVDVPLVSSDFKGNPKSAIFDATATEVMDGNFIKVFAWYDNEWGFSMRMIDVIEYISDRGI
ncbi:MAG: type I glyceraldehyde-3-phosphate dehydrogenase [bacterium]|nr:type I glyceraldehyde-3-phosphate dehydrogenase [bacterium]